MSGETERKVHRGADIPKDDAKTGDTTNNNPHVRFLTDGELMTSMGSRNDWGRWLRRNSSFISQHDEQERRYDPEMSPRTPRSAVEFELEEGLIMLIGPEKLTMEVTTSLELIVPKEVRVEQKSSLTPEEAGLLKQEEFLYILYVMDSSNSSCLKDVDEQLTFLQKNYSLSFDCLDFILAKGSPKGETSIDGKQVKCFMEKYKRPVITVILNKEHRQQSGDEKNLTDQMAFFLRRFELYAYSCCCHQ